jgi:hypothetical protein
VCAWADVCVCVCVCVCVLGLGDKDALISNAVQCDEKQELDKTLHTAI